MTPRFNTLILAVLVSSTAAFAQPGIQNSSLFRSLELPAPNTMRTGSGRPGADYWQQSVDYKISATLDIEHHMIDGVESIRYTNNSPDALPYLWMHVEPNMCAPESVSNQLDQPPFIFLGSVFDFSCKGFEAAMVLNRIQLNGQDLPYSITGTTMRVDLVSPLSPGATVEFEVAWQFPIPEWGMARMGRDESLYEIAQWYPRMAVYDDVRGWNNEPYIGAGEFYLEYGNFDVALTVPASYLVVASGVLQNPEDVLTATQRQRLDEAASSSEIIHVVSADEAGDPSRTRPTESGELIWQFRAENVRDFAFATSPDYRWDATGWNGILIQTLYRTRAEKWEEAIEMSRQTISHFSEQWYPYPYPHATTVEGPIEGMEYPMLTFVPDSPTREDLQWVLSHEFGHEWFPMIVGSNERFYPWMDEGFNTFMDLIGSAEYFEGTEYGDEIQSQSLNFYPDNAIPGQEQPMITRPTEQYNLFWTAYHKPALMLTLLRNEVLGPERFDHAFREYIRAWAYKHPTPSDFFRVMSDASGMDLDWFWRGWIFTAARLDQSVDSVVLNEAGETEINLVNNHSMVMPLEMNITFTDGAVETIRLPVEMWHQGPHFTYRVHSLKHVRMVEVDPRYVYPDDDRSNNVWTR